MEILTVYIREASFLSKEAQALVKSIDDLERRALTLHLLGRLEAKCERFDNAIALFKQAEETNKQINNPYGQVMALRLLGELETDNRRGNFDLGLNYLYQALDILSSQASREFEAPGEVERVKQLIADAQRKKDLFKDIKDEASARKKISQLLHQIKESEIFRMKFQDLE